MPPTEAASFKLKKPAGDPSAAWPAIVVGLFAAFGGILYGYDTGTISGIQTMCYWEREMFPNLNSGNIPCSQVTNDAGRISLIVSILSVGTFIGALAAGQLADRTGRRWGLILSAAFPFNLGVIMQVAATSQPLFIAGRAFAGLGVGLISVQVPMYQSETLPKWIRGFVVGCYQLAITIGLLLASLINYGTKDRNDSGSYRIPLAIQFAWALIIIIGMFLLPETPRFLVKVGKHEKALKSLCFFRRLPPDHPYIEAELAEIQANYNYEISLGTASYVECCKGTIGKRLFTGVTLQALQQLVGINFIFYYGTSYFASGAIPDGALPNAFILSVITNVVNTCSTFPGLYAIDVFGRRFVLLTGALGMGISQYLVAILGVATPNSNTASIQAQFAFICIYIFFFASTWGPAAWVVTSEMFPLKVRAKCLSITTASNWLMNFVLAFITPYLEGANYANLGSNVFWIWGGFCWISVVFVFFFIYETKNLTLEEVNELYGTTSKAWKSAKFRPKVSFREAEKMGVDRRASLLEIGEAQERRRSSVVGGKTFDNGADDRNSNGLRETYEVNEKKGF